MFRRASCLHSWGDWISSSECWIDAVEENFPVIRAKDGVGKFVKTKLLQNIGANSTARLQTQQKTLTWTTASVTTWPLASLYTRFCACQKIVSIRIKYLTEKYFGRTLWNRTKCGLTDQYTTSESLRFLGQPNKTDGRTEGRYVSISKLA